MSVCPRFFCTLSFVRQVTVLNSVLDTCRNGMLALTMHRIQCLLTVVPHNLAVLMSAAQILHIGLDNSIAGLEIRLALANHLEWWLFRVHYPLTGSILTIHAVLSSLIDFSTEITFTFPLKFSYMVQSGRSWTWFQRIGILERRGAG